MFDVIEVSIKEGYPVRVLDRNKTKENAEAVMNMAISRRGLDGVFYSIVPSDKFKDGDSWPKERKE